MNKPTKPWHVFLLVFALTIFGVAVRYKTEINNFRVLPAANFAKEYCSCRYVVGHSAGFCSQLLDSWVPISRVTDNVASKQIVVDALYTRQQASFYGPLRGCGLNKGLQ